MSGWFIGGIRVRERDARRPSHAAVAVSTDRPPPRRFAPRRRAAACHARRGRCMIGHRHGRPGLACCIDRSSLPRPRSRCSAGAAQAFTLDILHFNDFHSRIESINAFELDLLGRGRGGGRVLRRRRAAEDGDRRGARRRSRRPAATCWCSNAGDVFQGSLFFTTYQGAGRGRDDEPHRPRRHGLRQPRVRPRAGAAGEVHRDGGVPGALRQRRRLGRQPAGAAGRGPPGARGRRREGGDPRRDHPGHRRDRLARPSVSFRDPVAVPDRRRSTALEAEGVDKIDPARRTSGCADDIRVAEAVPGIDAIVGGHTHTLFSNTDAEAPLRLSADGRPGRTGAQVPIVQAGAYSKYLGAPARSTFDDAGNVTAATGDTMLLDASVTPDPDVLARIDELAGPIEELKARMVAEIARRHRRQPRDLPGGGMRDGQPRRRRDARPGEGAGGDDRAAERRRPARLDRRRRR